MIFYYDYDDENLIAIERGSSIKFKFYDNYDLINSHRFCSDSDKIDYLNALKNFIVNPESVDIVKTFKTNETINDISKIITFEYMQPLSQRVIYTFQYVIDELTTIDNTLSEKEKLSNEIIINMFSDDQKNNLFIFIDDIKAKIEARKY